MLKILVVDDNFANRQFFVELLTGKAVCSLAVNGKEAVEAFRQSVEKKSPFDLILLDIAMPEMNGLEFLAIIREDEKKLGIPLGDGIPIIMATAHTEPFMKAFNYGCDDYITKPIDPVLLFQKMEEQLEKRR